VAHAAIDPATIAIKTSSNEPVTAAIMICLSCRGVASTKSCSNVFMMT